MCPICIEGGVALVKTRDYTQRQAKADFQRARKAERRYGAQLRHIARLIGQLVRSIDFTTLEGMTLLRTSLESYANALSPWARAISSRMVADVAARDRKEWRKLSETMNRGLVDAIDKTDIGDRVQGLLADQVRLIKSLPLDAAERVHKLAMKAHLEGGRFDSIVKEINRTGEITTARATLIARTEVGRASTVITQARAEKVGSTGYIWRTVKDTDVRPSHKKMEGKFVLWEKPPTLDNLVGHAGALPNCRCYCEPVIPDPKY